jgi:hypothetical protein
VHGLLEVDGVEDFDAVIVPLQELSALDYNAAFRVVTT